jgi:Flp pilus assembly protein TadG
MTWRWSRAGNSFRKATGGVAAVEFALIIPLISGLVIGIIQYGGMIFAYQQMHNGVASGALYIMRGGSDPTTIQTLAMSAWPNQPSDASVTSARSCTCAGGAASCSSLCPDGSYPLSFTTITASGTYTGLFGTNAMSASQVVRTQ